MTVEGSALPFELSDKIDNPAIVGARWWNRELKDEERRQSRRAALTALGVGVLAIAGVGAIIAEIDAQSFSYQSFPSLALQRRFGWSFGAYGQPVTFDGRRVMPYDPANLYTLRGDCVGQAYAPHQSAALFDAIGHRPAETPGEPNGTFAPLERSLQPVVTSSMALAYRMGQALARLLARAPRRAAVIVDLVGMDSVALAAGLAETHAPVWKFDHWPHPLGVVPAHLTLARAAFFQLRFHEAIVRRAPDAPPVVLLDRHRLHPYRDDSNLFDNRYVATLPSIATLEESARVQDVIYIAPSQDVVIEAPDTIATLVSYRTRGLRVRALTGRSFFSRDYAAAPAQTDPIESMLQQSPLYYGGDAAAEERFAQHYFGADDDRSGESEVDDLRAWSWRPVAWARPAGYDAPADVGAPIGTASVAIQHGRIMGLRNDRNGSWNRVSSSSSSWGG